MTGARDRADIILPICEEKRVLDLGCGNPTENSLHREISKYASYAVGVEIDEKSVNSAQAAGYNIHLGDAESFKLKEKFKVALLSELIEHVSNPGLVLENVRKHLLPRGIMIVSTPNPFSPIRFKQDREGKEHPNHVVYYSPRYFCRLANRCGFHEEEIFWIVEDWKKPESLKGNFFAFWPPAS